ncbi:MAG TPA: L,D-transpeptidase [Clostridia bacterium]|nr:L,D-transpeptidase [Clostridia bacterium]
MKFRRIGILLIAIPAVAAVLLASCMDNGGTPGVSPLAASDVVDVTLAPTLPPSPTPEPTPAPTPVPAPTPEPMPTPELTAYRSAAYPLAPKSLRTREGGRYPEEEKLNEDPLKFIAIVDLTNQAVMIYEKDVYGNYSVLVREMICSSGIEATDRSPRGTFTMGEDKKRFAYFNNFDCYAQYWAQIRDRIYFHSVPYSERDDRYLMEEEFWKLGTPASHGCIRLGPDDAQWVYLYLCPGTTVVITDDLPKSESLRARLIPKATPAPTCYMIAP